MCQPNTEAGSELHMLHVWEAHLLATTTCNLQLHTIFMRSFIRDLQKRLLDSLV